MKGRCFKFYCARFIFFPNFNTLTNQKSKISMRKIFLLSGLGIAILGSMYIFYKVAENLYPFAHVKNELLERSHEPVLGIYAPNNNISQDQARNIKHYALVLNLNLPWQFNKKLLEKLPSHDPVLLTVETWGRNVLTNVAEGQYDAKLKFILSHIPTNTNDLYIRWNPEMEVPAQNNPWNNRPATYIEAFNRFAQITQEAVPRAHLVYGPAGFAGALENYPGDDTVNAASITLNSDSEKNTSTYEKDSLPTQIKRKLHRMRFINRPIFILGSKNIDLTTFNSDWILNALDTIKEHKQNIYSTKNFERPTKKWLKNKNKFHVGLYDPDALLVDEPEVSVEHVFVNFSEIQNGSFVKQLDEVLLRNHDIIISVEPKTNEGIRDSDILEEILKGKYDNLFEKFYSSLSNSQNTIFLRFAHEMEIPVNRYPWQKKDPILYIQAFRYFMNFHFQENIKKVWGPAGDRGSLEWWPGNDVVDFISIAVYGLPDKNITDPKKQESFATILGRKSWRLRFVDKPIFITEFGVKGKEDFQTAWLENAAKTLNKNPHVIGVSYFNKTDVPKAWGEVTPPDWSITKASFRHFIETLEKDLELNEELL